MLRLVFVEGVSGVGKTTMVRRLAQAFKMKGKCVNAYLEGDADSPLDLCWTAYLEPFEYHVLVQKNPDLEHLFREQLLYYGDYVLLRYRIDRKPLYPQELDTFLHNKEFCYNPASVIPLFRFTEVFQARWREYAACNKSDVDYEIYDASLVGHITNDMMRNYGATPLEMAKYLNALLKTVNEYHPVVFYLYTENVEKRIIDARIARKQPQLSPEKLQFWKNRALADRAIFSLLNAEKHWIDISEGQWDDRLIEIKKILNEKGKQYGNHS